MKKVVIITSSLRVNSNSDLLANSFKEGALSAGHEVELISLKGKKLDFCRGCMACAKLGRCVMQDDANPIMEKICEADVVVWATPTYYYTMSGNMKTLIDRCNALFNKDYIVKLNIEGKLDKLSEIKYASIKQEDDIYYVIFQKEEKND